MHKDRINLPLPWSRAPDMLYDEWRGDNSSFTMHTLKYMYFNVKGYVIEKFL
jgi:hypothetical protein